MAAQRDKSSHMRAAEDSAAEYMVSCRRALCGNEWSTQQQRDALQAMYDDAHEHHARLVCEQATVDAEQALGAAETQPYVTGLLHIARNAGQHMAREQVGPELLHRWRLVDEVNSGSVVERVTDLHDVAVWRSTELPRAAVDWGTVDWIYERD
jgi:hypothetical protein